MRATRTFATGHNYDTCTNLAAGCSCNAEKLRRPLASAEITSPSRTALPADRRETSDRCPDFLPRRQAGVAAFAQAIRSAALPVISPRSTRSCTASASSNGRTSVTSGQTSPRATISQVCRISERVT